VTGDHQAAREHIQRSIAAGGLSRQESLNARLALVNVGGAKISSSDTREIIGRYAPRRQIRSQR
jgi:hypothetical protein